ncbi:MAG TPA: hypothetical protein VIE43_16380 [Thermoanaerobaculia bacterium]|jgi:hypothetical protein|nr:hypothetical protein [Thermoanaerobaculia bacterium]
MLKTSAEANQEASKLDALARELGMSVMEFIDIYALDDVSPGICMNPECDYTTDVEPDQREGWCEECDTTSVKSGVVLAGLI